MHARVCVRMRMRVMRVHLKQITTVHIERSSLHIQIDIHTSHHSISASPLIPRLYRMRTEVGDWGEGRGEG